MHTKAEDGELGIGMPIRMLWQLIEGVVNTINPSMEDKRKEDLDNREAAITRRELTAVAKEQLNAAGVPADMADFIDYTDADSVNESVKRLSKAFKGAVQQSVDDRLKGKAPLDKAKNNVLTAEEENARKAFANALKF